MFILQFRWDIIIDYSTFWTHLIICYIVTLLKAHSSKCDPDLCRPLPYRTHTVLDPYRTKRAPYRSCVDPYSTRPILYRTRPILYRTRPILYRTCTAVQYLHISYRICNVSTRTIANRTCKTCIIMARTVLKLTCTDYTYLGPLLYWTWTVYRTISGPDLYQTGPLLYRTEQCPYLTGSTHTVPNLTHSHTGPVLYHNITAP